VTIPELVFAVEDCQRFINRTKPILDAAQIGTATDEDARKVRNLSLDVTRSLIELRKGMDARAAEPAAEPFSVNAML